MREFSLSGAMAHFGGMAVEMSGRIHEALERGARIIEAEAKAEIGTYQGAAGQFAAWSPLADATKADRVAQGFPADEPLLRTGELRDSISHRVEVDGPSVSTGTAQIGSDSPIAEYQELGTSRIPPRSFLGGAAVRKSEEVVSVIGEHVVSALTGDAIPGGGLPISG